MRSLGDRRLLAPPEDDFHELSTAMRAVHRSPEQRLMAAVLDDGCSVSSHPERARSRGAQRLLAQTEDWVASDEVSWPFSFRNVCLVLGLDPMAVRAVLYQRRQHRLLAA
jgi:hypothetical protein